MVTALGDRNDFGPPRPVADQRNATATSPRLAGASTVSVPASVASGDTVVLQSAAIAALELGVLQQWGNEATPASAAAEYRLAQEAVQRGDPAAALRHLEAAILEHKSYAADALQDPAFRSVSSLVLALVGRLTILARTRAEAALAAAASALESAGIQDSQALAGGRAYWELAQARLQSHSYAGYVEALAAAVLAQQTAVKWKPEAAPPGVMAAAPGRWGDAQPRGGRLRQAARHLWRRLPLLAILLAWLAAGIAGGVAALPFQDGSIAVWRQILFPIWALGLLLMVLIGFTRSLVRMRRSAAAKNLRRRM